jgi:L-cysteine/cystine lyase
VDINRTYDLAAVRAAIPALRQAVYLNTGTFGPSPTPVLDAVRRALDLVEQHGAYAPIVRQQVEHEAYESARAEAAALLGATTDEIILTRSASDGINTLAYGLDWQPGDEVVITAQEHPSGVLPWLTLARRAGINVRVAPVTADPERLLAEISRLLSGRTRLVFASHVAWSSGQVLPAAEICRLARAAGALAVLDGAHALGQLPVDVRAIGCDAYVGCGHKWLLGPQGTSFAYLARERLEAIQPSWIGWGAQIEDSLDLEARVFELQPSARRFEFGTKAWPLFPGLARAIHFVRAEMTVEAIQAHVRPLAAYLRRAASALPGCRCLAPQAPEQCAGIVSLEVADAPAGLKDDLYQRHGVIAAYWHPLRCLRLSVAGFTTQADLDRALAAIEDCLQGASRP